MSGYLAGPTLIVGVIWALVGLGILVWYLWAMARLFPHLGLRAGEGWIPIWNQWRLLERTGMPGWMVLLNFVGLGIIPAIMLIVAMHRVNTAAGVGAGYTVLGAFIPPLWATLLGSILIRQESGPPAFAGTRGVGGATPAGTAAPQPVYAPQAGTPVAAPPAQPGRSTVDQSPLGLTTDAEYARLAAESFAAPPAAPLGAPLAPEPFSWTAASQSREPEVASTVDAPPIHRVPAPPAAPVASGSAVLDPESNDTDALPPLPPEPPTPAVRASDSPWAPSPPAAPASAQAAARATGITGMFAPLPADAPAPTPPPAPGIGADDDERTVLVPRRSTSPWSLVLPDGEAFPLAADTIVGRRPLTVEGAELLTIHDPTRTLSKTHARVRIDGASVTVEDLGSTNGLLLLHDDGRHEEIPPHVPVAATERMLFGTLEVTLRHGGGA